MKTTTNREITKNGIRKNPIRSIRNNSFPQSFTEIFDQLFQNNFTKFFDNGIMGFNNSLNSIPVNVKENDTNYELQLVAPGLKKEDFIVTINDNSLSIEFNHEDDSTINDGDLYIRKEYKKQSFKRTFSLDDNIDTSKIDCNYNNGILKMTLPKKEVGNDNSKMKILEIK